VARAIISGEGVAYSLEDETFVLPRCTERGAESRCETVFVKSGVLQKVIVPGHEPEQVQIKALAEELDDLDAHSLYLSNPSSSRGDTNAGAFSMEDGVFALRQTHSSPKSPVSLGELLGRVHFHPDVRVLGAYHGGIRNAAAFKFLHTTAEGHATSWVIFESRSPVVAGRLWAIPSTTGNQGRVAN
jgi:hypothetical protein